MAGSSMDGLDLAYVNFKNTPNGWIYQLEKCCVIPYPINLFNRLKTASSQSKNHLRRLDVDFGQWISTCINEFIINQTPPDLLGVHGHTVVHKPSEHVSWQLGDGSAISSETGIATVTEFRTLDVQEGGQGAPLVPFGDFHLFSSYDACLNLGGIANISLIENKTAWDICPCNQVLNYFAEKLGKAYDKNGDFAKSGKFDQAFYTKVSSLDYFEKAPPKSLPNNFIEESILKGVEPMNGLHTYSHIIADQVLQSLCESNGSKLLITGGGAFNGYLIDLIRSKLENWDISASDSKLIEFKESLVFAFLALKRMRNEINTLASVTGASKDTSSGVIHLP